MDLKTGQPQDATHRQLPGVYVERVFRGRPIRWFVTDAKDHMQQWHLDGKFYEADELDVIGRYAPKGGVYLDVGANVGNHTVYFGAILEASRLIPIDPNPNVAAALRINCLLNGLTTLDGRFVGRVALSDEAGVGVLQVPRNNSGAGRIHPGKGTIPIRTGDSLFAAEKIDFIKVDVEGMELQVLRGLVETIRANRPVLFVEVDDANRDGFDAWVAAERYRIVERFKRYEANENFLLLPT